MGTADPRRGTAPPAWRWWTLARRPPGPAPPHAATGRHRLTQPGPQPAPGPQHPGHRATRAHQHAGPPVTAAVRGADRTGTAVAISAAVALARIHRRRRYRPGTVLTSSLEPSMPPPPVIAALDRAARTPAIRTPPADGTGPDDTEPDLDLDLYEPYEQPFPGPREPGRAAAPRRPAPRPRSRQASRAPSRPRPARSPSASATARRSPPTPPPSAASA